eukprot:3143633-Karenia_brevis.AAC.1
MVALARIRQRLRESGTRHPSHSFRSSYGRAWRCGITSADQYRTEHYWPRRSATVLHHLVLEDLTLTLRGGARADLEDDQGKSTADTVESCEELVFPTFVEDAKAEEEFDA